MSNALLTEILQIKHPIIMAPMFLVSNDEMIISGIKAGITAAIPALNYRNTDLLRKGIQNIKQQTNNGVFGINLIVNKSNLYYKEQLKIICEEKVSFIITSLGSPEETIIEAHKNGIKVFCDVTDLKYALKVQQLGADAIIAVNSEAGGHAGSITYKELIPDLINNCRIPIISAGGVGDYYTYKSMMDLGVAGVSVGTIFIASEESPVTLEYKQACVTYGKNDIVKTTKLSGTPCTVINTPYVQKIGTEQSFIEKILNKNKKLKKYVKSLVFFKGMKTLEKAAFSASYKSVWCAGPTIEYVKNIRSIEQIVNDLINENK